MTRTDPSRRKVGVIGAGSVGATIAFVLNINNTADEIVIVDKNESRARGEALDISHCVPFVSPKIVRDGTYEDIADADIIIVTVGVPLLNKKGGIDLMEKNLPIVREISEQLVKVGFDGILLNISNPVDLLTHAFYKLTNLSPGKVMGSGTVLDSATLRFLLGTHCGYDPRSIHIYIIGEHGDREIPVWSQANIAGMSLNSLCCNCNNGCKCVLHDRLFDEAKFSGYFIEKGKGSTNYSIAMSTLNIVQAVLNNENRVLPVSTLIDGYLGINGIYLSIPSVINRQGVRTTISLELNDKEKNAFLESAQRLQKEASKYHLF